MCGCNSSNKTKNNGAKILFTGSYDVLDAKNTIISPCSISINQNGYNMNSTKLYHINKKNISNGTFLYDTYSISSYDLNKKKIGVISFNAINITKNGIQLFYIVDKSGIYSNVNKVVIDFRKKVRQFYFIG